MMPADLKAYARRRVVETCDAQKVPLMPDAATLAAASALLGTAREVSRENQQAA